MKRLLVISFAGLIGCMSLFLVSNGHSQVPIGPQPGADTGGAGAGPYGNADNPFGAGQEPPVFAPAPTGPVPFAAGSSPAYQGESGSSFPGPTGGSFPGMDTTTGGSAGTGTGTNSTLGGSGTGSFGLDRGAAGGGTAGRPGGAAEAPTAFGGSM